MQNQQQYMFVEPDDTEELKNIIENFVDTDANNIEEHFEALDFESGIDKTDNKLKISLMFGKFATIFMRIYRYQSEEYEIEASIKLNSDPYNHHKAMMTVDDVFQIFCGVLCDNKTAYRDEVYGYTIEHDDIIYDMRYEDGEIKNVLPR